MITKMSGQSFTGLYILPNNRQSQEVMNHVKDVYKSYPGTREITCRESLNAIIVKFLDITQLQKYYTDNFAAFVNFHKERQAEKLLVKKIKEDNIPFYYANDPHSLDLTRNPKEIANIVQSLNGSTPVVTVDTSKYTDINNIFH